MGQKGAAGSHLLSHSTRRSRWAEGSQSQLPGPRLSRFCSWRQSGPLHGYPRAAQRQLGKGGETEGDKIIALCSPVIIQLSCHHR